MTSLKTSIKTITYLSDTGCLEIQGGQSMTIIEHTDVDESLKGQGIGKRLVAKVVEKNAPGEAEDYPAMSVCETRVR